ncbi:MAG: substrate-binding domain-containing protein [Neisseriaceae bacterium]|nr:substrate-binding domain-containing protein [Neisseriaceae bacterium]
MKMRKLCMLMSMALGLVACDSSQNKDVSKIPETSIGASISSIDTNPFFEDMYNTLRTVGSENPQIHLQLDSAHDSEEQQNKQIEAMINSGAKALVVLLVSPKTGAEFAAKMCDRRIPVVYVYRSPGDKALQECDIAYYAGPDDRQAGILQAGLVLEGWQEHPEWDKNGDGKMQVAVLEGTVGVPSSKQRSNWVISSLKFHPEGGLGADSIDVVFRETGKYDTTYAKEVTEKWLKSPDFDKVEVIISSGDSMSMGLVEVLEQNNKKLPIYSINGMADAVDAMKRGRIEATIQNDQDTFMRAAVRIAANLTNDRPALEGLVYDMDEGGSVLVPLKRLDK